jgi:diguanylate cyclase (GGDEF)-like protein
VGQHPSSSLRWALTALAAWLAVYGSNLIVHAAPRTGLVFGKPSHLVVDFGGALLCALGALRRRGSDRIAWLLIAAGILAWAAGDVYWTVALADAQTIPVPSLGDMGYLLFPVLAFLGLAAHLRARVRRAPRHLWVDGLTASLATASVAAAVVVPIVVDSVGGDWKSVATNVAYPLSDLILLGLVVGAVALRGWRLDRTWVLAGAGIVTFWVADTHYLFAVAQGGGGFPDPFDLGWDCAFVALAAASVLPATAARTAKGRGRRSILLPLAFGATGLGVLVYAGLHDTTPVAVVLAGASLAAVGTRLWILFTENRAMLEATRHEAVTDALTGLGNRRALAADLEDAIGTRADDPVVLVLFDLDGFKSYNDAYGHPAGDELLVRLGAKLGRRVAGSGRAYRMGGDEFCALLRPDGVTAAVAAADAAAALSERGEGFDIGSSHGQVVLPAETDDPAEALRLADQRMYAQKHRGRASAGSQSRDVLLRALAERNPDLGEHLTTVAELAVAVAGRLGLPPGEIEQVRQAADLHDVGKVAIPDAILNKPAALDD